MKLIVTRPTEDAEPLAKVLRARGHDPILLPLMQIVPRHPVDVPDAAWQAICFTSANAPRVMPARDQWKNLPVFTVGPQSKSEAQRRGYTSVVAMGGNVEGLSAALAQNLKPQDGPLLYMTGSEISGDLKAALEAQGFAVTRIVVYDARPCETPGLAEHLPDADGVLLYSPRSARLWQDALARYGAEVPSAFTHYCLSKNVAGALPDRAVCRIASQPDEQTLLALLDRQGEAA